MELSVEKLVYGGDGLAHGPADQQGSGKAVLLPFVLPGERVEARVVEERPGFIRAAAERVVQASAARVQPECPYFGRCGGCHYQHASYEQQLDAKAAILGETLQRIAHIEAPPMVIHASPPWHYRNRTRLKVSGGTGCAIGYFRTGSHELLPVEHCPISSPLINRALAALRQLSVEHRLGDTVQEVCFFANDADDRLLIELTLSERSPGRHSSHGDKKPGTGMASLAATAAALRQTMPEIAGVGVFRAVAGGLERVPVSGDRIGVFGADELVYTVGGWNYRVSQGSFFQTNRFLTSPLLQIVTGNEEGDAALDLYAGTGFFSLPLAQHFRQLTAVESSPFSGADLRSNVPPQVRVRRQQVESFLQGASEAFDLVVVDPPRSGLGERAAACLGRLSAARITYVSCDPATLARDLKSLLGAGFRIDRMHLVDLFPQTFHLESVTKLVR